MIAFLCAGCGKSLKVKDELAGRKGRCPHCQQPMSVPIVSDAAGADGYSETDAKTVLPPALDTDRDLATVPPSGPRSAVKPKKGNTVVPGVPSKKVDAELYDFLAPAEAKDEIGRLGAYRVLKVLGAGGMGVVFQAEDPKLNRLVALKAMLPALAASPSNAERFLREARAAAKIEHDHIVAIYQIGEERGVPFIAMPFLRGEALEDRIKRERKMPIAEALRIGKETAEGLAAAHEHNMIHRDIKPANIWLEGEKRRVKILDFGLARSVRGDSQLTQQGSIVGTPAYMAPEQGAGKEVDTRCDLFSLGCVLYRLVTGTLPFKGADTVSTLVAVATETPTAPRKLNPEVSPRFSKLIMELLAKDPLDRPPSALSVVDLIEELQREPPPDQTQAIDAPATRVRSGRAEVLDIVSDEELEDEERPARRSMMPILLGAGAALALLLVAGIVAIVYVLKKTDTPEVAQNDNKSIEQPVVKQPPVEVKPPPVVKVDANDKTKPGGNDVLETPVKKDPVDTKPMPKKNEPREANKTFKPYDSAVKSLVFAPDGKHFFSFGERNSRVDYWELATRKIVQSFELGGSVSTCLISTDGSRLIAYNTGRLRVWDVDGGQALAQVIAPDGWRIVGGGFLADKDIRAALAIKAPAAEVVQIYDNATKNFLMVNPKVKKPIPIRILHTAEVKYFFFGPDCKRAVSWCQDRTFRTWDLEKKVQANTFPVSPGEAKSVAVSKDFSRLMGTFNQPNVFLYDVEAGTELKDIKPKDFGNTDTVAFGSESNVGVVGGFPGTIQVLDLDSGEVKKQLKAGAFVSSVALSPDGKTVLSGDIGGTIYVHKLED